jgi:hypothetical protein
MESIVEAYYNVSDMNKQKGRAQMFREYMSIFQNL